MHEFRLCRLARTNPEYAGCDSSRLGGPIPCPMIGLSAEARESLRSLDESRFHADLRASGRNDPFRCRDLPVA